VASDHPDSYFRLPRSTLEAVRDGEVSWFDWAIYVWLATNAEYQTGLIRTCAPNVANECRQSVHMVRKAFSRLRSQTRWIYYDDRSGKRGVFPIGIYGLKLPDGLSTPSAEEWENPTFATCLAAEGGPAARDWTKVWIRFTEDRRRSQLVLGESSVQSSGESNGDRTGETSERKQPTEKTAGKEPITEVPVESSGEASGEASGDTPGLGQDQVPARHPIEEEEKEKEHTYRPPVSVSPSSIHTDARDWRIWGEYGKRYEQKSGGIVPGHSARKAPENLRLIREQLDALRKSDTTQEEYEALLGECLDRYFEQDDKFVVDADWNLATFAGRLPKILKEIRAESRRAG